MSTNKTELTRHLYLDLLKRCLINMIYDDPNQVIRMPDGRQGLSSQAWQEGGRAWRTPAHTMIGLKRLNNVQACLENVLSHQIPGDVIETGVWRGGATIFMRGILKAYDITDRLVWVADSFEGLPPPNVDKYPDDELWDLSTIPELAISLEEVKANFERYDLLDEQVRFLKGWFKDTLPTAPIGQLAILRLDGDLYESTMDALVNLYPKVSSGGFVIVDDYGAISACRKAVHDYLNSQNLAVELHSVDWTAAYWQKPV